MPKRVLIPIALPPLCCLLGVAWGAAQNAESVHAQRSEAERRALIDRTAENQKRNDAALDLYERIERVERRKTASDEQPAGVRVLRVVPAGTGTDRIPLGPEGKPAEGAAYRQELEKLVRLLEWAAQDGRTQRDAYQKVAKKKKERGELVDATRTAFLYTWVADEPRGERVLSKYRMGPNPAFRPTSRATSFFPKVRGFVWIDESDAQVARIEAAVIEDISIGVFLAKVYKGSRFVQEQYEVAPGVWLPSYTQYDFDGRKFFSSVGIHERTFYSQYRRIGPPKEALPLILAELNNFQTTNSDP